MTTINAHFDGKAIVPDEPVNLAADQKLRITIEALNVESEAAAAAELRVVHARDVKDEPIDDKTDYHAWIGKGLLGPRNPNPVPASDDDLWGGY